MRNAMVALGGMLMSFQVLASGSALINGKEVKSQDHLHSLLAKQLNFPSHYGKTLDSLYDTLSTDFGGQTIIKIKSLSILRAKLGTDYTDALIMAIRDASEDNPKVVLVID